MIERIVVAVDDSAPGLNAAAHGIDLAQQLGAEVHLVTVAEPGRDPEALLRHVVSGVVGGPPPVTHVAADGREPFEALIEAARTYGADMVVMGRSDRRRSGRPYVGSQTEHLLEFIDIPVVVVPETAEIDP